MLDYLKKHPVICKLLVVLFNLFCKTNKPTSLNLVLFVLSMLMLNSCKSVRFMFIHCIKYIAKVSLNRFYYMFNGSKIDVDDWTKELLKFAISLIPVDCPHQILLSVDDTLIEKIGEFFAYIGILHDHAKHNGTEYLHGHCFVCVVMSIPILVNGGYVYISFPIGYRLWVPENVDYSTIKVKDRTAKRKAVRSAKLKVDKNNYKNKLEIGKDLCEIARSIIGNDRTIILLGDSWYPKGAIRDFVLEHRNICGIFNVRKDTAIFDLPQSKTGKRGRPPKKGKQLFIDTDFDFIDVPNTDYRIGYKRVVTKLFGLDNVVMAVVTETRATKSRRLFISTDPDQSTIDISMITDATAKAIGQTVPELLCFCGYSFRWSVETNFLEQKTYWGLCDYMVRSMDGIQRLVNLQSLTYAVLSLLPYCDDAFASLRELSIQERRYELGRCLDREFFMATLTSELKNDPKYRDLAEHCEAISRRQTDFSKTGS